MIGEDDIYTILQELKPVANRWFYIGLALRLKACDLENIKTTQQGDDQITYMLLAWLKRSYDVERFGPPTWRRIVEAVRANSGGKNPALANILARKYNGEYII